MKKLRRPFFSINPKAYLYGDNALKLAKHADKLAGEYDIDCIFTAQFVDLPQIKAETKNLIISAQHMDGITVGRGMGHVLPESLVNVGVEAVCLNHAEKPMTTSELTKAIARAKEVGLMSIVCADSIEEVKAIATLMPDIMLCEEASCIGTGQVSGRSYMVSSNNMVKSISPDTLVLQGAGIRTGQNVYDAIMSGADGTGATSGIAAAADPEAVLDEMFEYIARARDEINEGR